jgi:hypothetical protein
MYLVLLSNVLVYGGNGSGEGFQFIDYGFDANEYSFLRQAPQEEASQMVLSDGSIEKTVRLRALCKVEWFENGQSAIVMPVSTNGK